jgi:hypothetical protein
MLIHRRDHIKEDGNLGVPCCAHGGGWGRDVSKNLAEKPERKRWLNTIVENKIKLNHTLMDFKGCEMSTLFQEYGKISCSFEHDNSGEFT